MSRKAIVECMVMNENNEHTEVMSMEKQDIINQVKAFVENMNDEDRKSFMKELAKEVRVAFGDDGGRKAEVRELLEQAREEGISIAEIAERMGISNKNVSSILTYLKKDGLKLLTRSDGRKVIEK